MCFHNLVQHKTANKFNILKKMHIHKVLNYATQKNVISIKQTITYYQ